jgi:hypothetical protein
MTEAGTEKKTSEHGDEALEQNESEKEGETRAIETSDMLLLNTNERFETVIKQLKAQSK